MPRDIISWSVEHEGADQTMEIFEYSQITLSGLTWEEAMLSVTPDDIANTEIQLAPGFAYTPEDWKTKVQAMGLDPKQIILSATHSHVAYRHVEFVDNEPTFFLEDPTNYLGMIGVSQDDTPRGWHIITKTNLRKATWGSGCSQITIQQHEADSELFDVIGKFPIEDGHRYEGAYYETLMRPVNQANAVERFEVLATEREGMFYCLMMGIVEKSEIASLPGFQDWEGPVDPEPFKEIASRFDVYVEEQELTIDERPVKALVFVGASGWDEWYRYQRDELVSENPHVEFLEYEPLVFGVCQIS